MVPLLVVPLVAAAGASSGVSIGTILSIVLAGVTALAAAVKVHFSKTPDNYRPRPGGMSKQEVDDLVAAAEKVARDLAHLSEVLEETTEAIDGASDVVEKATHSLEDSTKFIIEATNSVKTSTQNISETIDKGNEVLEELVLARTLIAALNQQLKEKDDAMIQRNMDYALLKTTLDEQIEVSKKLEEVIKTVLSESTAVIEQQKTQINVLEKRLDKRGEQLRFFQQARERTEPKESPVPEISLSQL